jgi:hypothetical protein
MGGAPLNQAERAKTVPTNSRWTFGFGSAAIFWTALALGIWLFFYFALGRERDEVRWFFAWYFAKPALWMALLALLFHNLWRNSGGTPRECSVVPWVVTILIFPVVAYSFILPVGLAGISAVK